jgi:hypothetical protein
VKPNVIIIHPKDNVGIVLEDIQAGGTIHLPDGSEIDALSDIPHSHKVLLADVEPGGDIVKYGEVIAQVKQGHKQGDWIHTPQLDLSEE